MQNGKNWKYLIVTTDGTLYGTNDRDETVEVAEEYIVIEVDYDAKQVAQWDDENNATLEIGSL